MAAAGMDPMRYLETKDPEESQFMFMIAQEFVTVKEEMNRNLASFIANAVWGALKR